MLNGPAAPAVPTTGPDEPANQVVAQTVPPDEREPPTTITTSPRSTSEDTHPPSPSAASIEARSDGARNADDPPGRRGRVA